MSGRRLLLFIVCTFCVVSPFLGCSSGVPNWKLVSNPDPSGRTSPSPRSRFAMTYDPDRQRTVLFGGWDGEPPGSGGVFLGDTWEWDGESWAHKGDSGPSARFRSAITYDPVKKRTVLFGGYNGDYLGDTWEWDGASWSEVSTTGPSGREDARLAFDPVRERIVLFGGASGGITGLNDTWEWNGSSWIEILKSGPSARISHVMAYSSSAGAAVLFGGFSESTTYDDTWTWDGDSWSDVSSDGPTARAFSSMATASELSAILLFGGCTNAIACGTSMNDLWMWDSGGWTEQPVANPPPARGMHQIVYDSARGKLILFGGAASTDGSHDTGVFGDTWEIGLDPATATIAE